MLPDSLFISAWVLMESKFAVNSTPLRDLVALFARVGTKAFGGQLPVHIWHSFVPHGRLTEKDYLEALNWCQCLPGPSATNLSAYLGWRFRGAWGALLSTVALVLPGAGALLLTSALLARVPQQHIVQGALSSVAAAAVGLLLGTTWRLSRSAIGNRVQLLVASVTFVLVGFLMVPVLLVSVLMVLVAWHLNKRNTGKNNEHPA
jgi:chromate transporter